MLGHASFAEATFAEVFGAGEGVSGPLEILTSSLPDGREGDPYSETLTSTGGTLPHTWSIISGSLPGGLSLNSATGEISGTPTEDGTFNFTVQVEDDAATTDTQALSIEVAPEGSHYTDYSEYPSGSLPGEWAHQWNTSGGFRVEDDAGATGGKRFRQFDDGDNAYRFLKWSEVPDSADVDITARIQMNDSFGFERWHFGIVVRGSGVEGSETGYAVHLASGGSFPSRRLHLIKYVDGAKATLDDPDGSWTDGVWYDIRFLVVGNLLRAKIWPAADPEPEDWLITEIDDDISAAGGVGIIAHGLSSNAHNYCDFFDAQVDPDAEALPPDAPTITEAESPQTTLLAESSAFSSSDPNPQHTATRWQVRLASASDWETLVVPEITTTAFLTSIAIDGMPEEADLEVRVAHVDRGVSSDFSDPVAFTSGTDTPLPETPVITDPVDEVGEDFVTATRTAFAHSEGVGDGTPDEDGELLPYELAAQFQVRESGESWDDAVIDTGLDDLYVGALTVTLEGLDPATNYEIRFRTQDGKYGGTSAWSNVVAFTTDAVPAVKPVTPTLTVDDCGWPETDVSSSEFDHPEGGATHQASRWWVGTEDADEVVRYRSIITSDAAELIAFVWKQLSAGVNYLAVSHQDNSDRWSDRSAAVTCTIRERPDVPLLTSHAAGTSLDDDATFAWSMPGSDTWAFTGELSADNGASWEPLFSGQETAEYTLSISGRPNGLYLLRIKACYPDASTDCSDWLTIPIRIDRTGVVSVDYRFSELSELPASWVPMWDPDGHVSWRLVDAELNPIDEAGAGDCIGLHARHTEYLDQEDGVLAFTEFGKLDTVDITVSFGIMLNSFVWHGWRFSQSRFTAAGPAYRALRAVDTGDRQAGYAARVDVGGRGWAYSGHECNSDTEALSDRARREKPQVARLFPDRVHLYGTSWGGAKVQMYGYREQRTRHWLFDSAGIQTVGDLSRGLTYSVLTEDEDAEESICRYRFVTYSARKRVTKTPDGHYRIRVQVYGPGIDAAAGPQIDRKIDPDEPLASDSSWSFGDALCGYCGLYYWQLPFLTNDPGVLFLSASITAPDTTIVNGPTLGAASVVGAS